MSLEEKSKQQIIADYEELKDKYDELTSKSKILEGIISNTNFDFWRLDKNGNMTFASKGKEHIVGYTPQEAMKMNLADFFPEFEHERAFQVFQQALQGKSETVYEFMTKHKEGHLIPLEYYISPIYEDGEIVGVQGIARDITTRKKIEKAKDDIERKLKNIIENSTNVFFTHDTNGFLSYMSPQVESLLGYKPEEMTSKWTEFNSNNPINKIAEENTQKAIETGIPQPPYELEQVRKDGNKVWLEVRETPIVENGKTVAIVGSLTDITKRKQAEERLEHREKLFMTISEISTDYAYSIIVTEEGKLKEDWHFGGFENITGYSVDELYELGGPIAIIHKDDLEIITNRIEQQLSGKTVTTESRIITKNGETRWIRDKGIPVFDDEGKKVVRIIGVAQDITEEKEAKQKLEESETKFRSLAENSKDYIMRYDREYRHLYMNPSALSVNGITEDDIIDKTHQEAGFPEDLCKLWEEGIDYVFKNAKETSVTFSLDSVNGEVFLDLQLSPEFDKKGNVNSVIGISRDITDLKRIEQELRENEEKLRVTFNSIGDAVITTDIHGNITNMNSTAEKLSGWNKKDSIGQSLDSIFYIINSKTGQKAINPVNKVLETGKIIGLANHTVLISKDGSKKQIADSAAPIESRDGNIIGVVLVFRDVTDEYNKREELKKSQYQLNRGQKIANFGSWEFNLNNNQVHSSEQARIIYGVEVEKDFTISNIQQIPLPRYRNMMDKALSYLIKGEGSYDIEFEIKRPNDGEIRLIHSIAEYDKETNKVYGIIHDITEQRKIESALKQSEENFRLLAENARDFILVHDLQGKITYANPMAYEFIGYSEEEVQTMTLMDFIPPEQFNEMFERFDKRAEGYKKHFLYEVTIIKKNGERSHVEISSSPIERAGHTTSILLVVRDISERKEFLKQLELTNSAMESSIDGIAILNDEEEYIYVNNAHAEIYGYDSPKELIGKTWELLYAPDELKRFKETIMQELFEKGEWHGDAVGKKKDGSLFDQEISLTTFSDSGLVCIVRDISDRIQNQKRIQHNEELLQETGRLARIGGWEVDLIKNKLFWTKITKEIHEVDDDYEPSLDTAFDFFLPDSKERLRKSFEESAETGKPYDLELEFITFKGNHIWTRTIGKPALENGKCIGIKGVFQDITNRKNYEKTIKESELKYRQLVENINDLVWEVDENDVYTFINSRSQEYLGLKPEDVIGKKCSDFLKSSEKDRYEYFFDELFLSRKSYTHSIFTYIKSDGTESIWESSGQPRYNEKNKFIGFRGISRDITDRKKAQDALKQSEEINKALTQATLEGIVFLLDGYIIECNDAMMKLLGYTYDELIGKFAIEFIAPESKKLVKENMLSGYKLPYEALVVRKDGSKLWAEFHGKQQIYKEKKIRVTAVRDITERKEAETALLRAKEKAEQSDALKSAFLANMSHEIRSPMNAIIGFARLLQDPDINDDERKEFTNIINNKSKQLLALINDIIDISKIESGIIDINYRHFNLNELLRDVRSDFLQDTKEKHIELKLNTPLSDSKANINFDPARLKQIIINLTSNAIKFTEKGSVTIGYEIKKNKLKIYVEDTGIGIDEKYHKLIFERFRQIDNSYTKLYGGTGLGLTIVRELIGFLDGKIKLESEVGKGSIFIVKLLGKFSDERKSMDSHKQKSDNIKIDFSDSCFLVVEDEFSNYKLLERILSKRNADIIWAKNGKEAIDLYKENKEKIDVILMDLKMPVMDGFQATKVIKEMNQGIPIIALTAYAMAADEKRSLDAGCDEYLSKPLSIDKLISILSKRI